MNDQQLFENYYHACRVYAENNGGNVTDNFCILRDDGDGKVYIAEWNHNSPKPTNEQLKDIPISSINRLRSRKKNTEVLKYSKITVLSKTEIDVVDAEEGMIVLNSTDKKMYVFTNGSWKNLSGFLGIIL
jgi:XkdW protein.